MTVATKKMPPLSGNNPPKGNPSVTDQSTIQQVDPRTLLVDRNIRHQLGIEPEFVASIREDGVLQPITVVRTHAGDYRVRPLGLLGVPYGVAYRDGVTKLRELIAEATEARAQVITLGLILGAQEGATSVMSWRSVNPGTARYLLLLEANGYPLSNVERRATGQEPLPEADD